MPEDGTESLVAGCSDMMCYGVLSGRRASLISIFYKMKVYLATYNSWLQLIVFKTTNTYVPDAGTLLAEDDSVMSL